MAKGDALGGSTNQGTPQQPKIDQYSVMHKLMDALNGNQPAQNMAPSPDMTMPNPVMGGAMNGGAPSVATAQTPMGGHMGFKPQPRVGTPNNMGAYPGGMDGGGFNPGNPPPNVSPIGPSNPQETLRRGMIGARTFGGV